MATWISLPPYAVESIGLAASTVSISVTSWYQPDDEILSLLIVVFASIFMTAVFFTILHRHVIL